MAFNEALSLWHQARAKVAVEHCRQAERDAKMDVEELSPTASTSVKLSWWLMNRVQQFVQVRVYSRGVCLT